MGYRSDEAKAKSLTRDAKAAEAKAGTKTPHVKHLFKQAAELQARADRGRAEEQRLFARARREGRVDQGTIGGQSSRLFRW